MAADGADQRSRKDAGSDGREHLTKQLHPPSRVLGFSWTAIGVAATRAVSEGRLLYIADFAGFLEEDTA